MRVVMMGTGAFAEPTFRALIAGPHPVVGLVTQPDRGPVEKRGSTRQTGQGMPEIAAEHDIPVARPVSINTPEGVALLRDMAPDIVVVAAYGQILSADVIRTPTTGMINVHASLLPKYRGAAPVAWAILRGETESGVSIIRVTPTLDGGEVLAQESTPIGERETSGELETQLAAIGAKLCSDVVGRMAAGPVSGFMQDPQLVTKARKLKKEDGLLTFDASAAEVALRVRAMQPWPGPFAFLHRPNTPPLRLIITRVSSIDGPPGSPGEVAAEGKGLRVCCGDGNWLRIEELQPPGKRRMAGDEFARGYPVVAGWRLGKDENTDFADSRR